MKQRLSSIGPLVFALAVAHAWFAWKHRDLRPVLDVLTPPPGLMASKAAAAGDSQFLYRVWALDLQNAGDTGGRVTRMADYNYDFVLGWLRTLQALDPRSHQHDFLAGNYFSLTPNLPDVRRIAEFIAGDVDRNPGEKWMWLARVIEIAVARLKDNEYALLLSQRLVGYNLPDMSFILLSLPAIFLEKLGRYAEARESIDGVLEARASTLTPDEKMWIENFIHRLPD